MESVLLCLYIERFVLSNTWPYNKMLAYDTFYFSLIQTQTYATSASHSKLPFEHFNNIYRKSQLLE